MTRAIADGDVHPQRAFSTEEVGALVGFLFLASFGAFGAIAARPAVLKRSRNMAPSDAEILMFSCSGRTRLGGMPLCIAMFEQVTM